MASLDLQRIYQTRFKGRISYRDRVWRVLIRDYFQRFIHSEDTVLDLGAGYGEFINNVICGKKYAMDLNPDTVHLVHESVEVFPQDCAEPWLLPDDSLDVVFTSNFFEHLPDTHTLTRTLLEAKRCLKPGGKMIAMGPNVTYCGKAYWNVTDHCLALSEKTLSDACVHAGLILEKCIDRFMPFTMSEGPQYPAIFVAAYLRLPFAWRIFGKQFLIVAQKQEKEAVS